MTLLLSNSLLAGALIGCYYALLAVGLSLILGVVRVFNMAHGEFLVIGAYLAYGLWSGFGIDPLFAVLPAAALLFVLGLVVQAGLTNLGEPRRLNGLVVTLGLSMLLQNLLLQLWTGDYQVITVDYLQQAIAWRGITIGVERLIAATISVTIILALHLFIGWTYPGKAMRATAQDREAAEMMGIDVERVDKLTFGLGAALAGAAGPLFVALYYVQPAAGREPLIIALVLAIWAGVGQTASLLVGGILLGVIEALAVVLLGAQWRELLFFLVLLGSLFLRPQGLRAGLS